MAEEGKRTISRSPAFPNYDIDQTIGFLRRLHAKDRWVPIPLDLAAKHLGYASLSGQPRGIFATLKQYGLISYKTEGDKTFLVMSDLAKKALGNLRDEDLDEARALALDQPRIYGEIKRTFEGWDGLPSPERLAAMLEMKYGFNPAAAATLDRVLRRNLATVEWRGTATEAGSDSQLDDETLPHDALLESRSAQLGSSEAGTTPPAPAVAAGLQQLIMPGHQVFLAIPEKLESEEARRILYWLEKVVNPTIRFAGKLDVFEQAWDNVLKPNRSQREGGEG